MIFLLRLTSNITDLRRASNSPRYFDPEVKRLREEKKYYFKGDLHFNKESNKFIYKNLVKN